MTRPLTYGRGGGRTKGLGSARGAHATEGGYYHDNLRVAARDRVEQVPGERRCGCGKKLASFNRSDSCYACQKKGAAC